jgi:hypothetical protein
MQPSQMFDANTVAAMAAAVAAAISAFAAYLNLKQVRQSDKERMASICLEVSQRYNELYPDLILLARSPIRWEEFDMRYPDADDKLASEEWKLLRKAGGFFELVGVMVEDGLVTPEVLFKFMNIRPRIWLANEETILRMRARYNQELWIYWERLVKKYYESNDERWRQKALDLRSIGARTSAVRAMEASSRAGTDTKAK